MKTLTTVLLLFTGYLVTGQTYVSSYRITIEKGVMVDFSLDSAELAYMPTLFEEHLTIEYHGGYYYFTIGKLVHDKWSSNYLETFTGVGVFHHNPYSIRLTFNHNHTTLWVIPMLFHPKGNINNLRGFMFTDDPQRIKRLTHGRK